MNERQKNEAIGRHKIELGFCLVDWLTLTSFAPQMWSGFGHVLSEITGLPWPDCGEPHKIHVYHGHQKSLPGMGWMFLGSGDQNGKENVMLRVSGRLADMIFNHRYVQSVILDDIAKASRIDLQVTVIEPERWSQWELMKDMKERGQNVRWEHSYDRHLRREMATIYHGSRYSERMTRLYEKASMSGVILLRFETEYKKHRARQVAKSLCGEMKGKGWQYLSHEMNSFKDWRVNKAMSGVLLPDAAATEKIVRERGLDTTYEWLKGAALPVLDRYLKQHDNAGKEIADILTSMLVNRANTIKGVDCEVE